MCSKPDVPKEFLKMYYGPNSNPEERKKFEEWVRSKREKVKRELTFDSIQAAMDKAVSMKKQDPLSHPSVWKEPRDMGKGYTVVRSEHRENAYVAGYKEVITEQDIHDMAKNKKPNLAPEEGPNGVDRWTSNGYGITVGGKKVVPFSEKDDKGTEGIKEEEKRCYGNGKSLNN